MKINFCTLFNSNYMSRGLVMYDSLLAVCSDFHLYVFAFDEKCYTFLKALHLEHMTVVSLQEFEDRELLRVKPSRSAAEYCWTSTASTILYSMTHFSLQNCTYIDADMFFYSDPIVLIEEMGSKSVLITEHRYAKEHDQSKDSGKYCVQFVTFKNDVKGMEVLNWWRSACIEWCYDRMEDGKFGDQKYLDDWTTRFEGVHELKHLGGGIAPWNVSQYSFVQNAGKIVGEEIATGNKFNAVFFHFHAARFYADDIAQLTGLEYTLTKDVISIFYLPYIKQINFKKNAINAIDASFNPNGQLGNSSMKPMSIGVLLFFYLRDLKRSFKNVFGKNMKYHIAHHYFYKMK